MLLQITAIFVALFSLMMIPLSLAVSLHYAKTGTHQGMPGILEKDELLRRKTRAHGNFIENVPMGLILLACLEFANANSEFLWVAGSAFLFARLIHAIGQLSTMKPLLRGIGMMIGHVYFASGAAYLLAIQL